MNEASPLEPHPDWRGAYTESKVQAEQTVMDAIEKGLPAVILRPGQIFGPGAETVPPYGTLAMAGRWIVVGGGKIPLPLVYIDDVVDALLLAAKRDGVCGRILQLVDPERITQREYIDRCREHLGDQLRVMYVPRPVFYAAGIAIGALGALLRRSVPLTRYKVSAIRGVKTFDCSAAREHLGWTPQVGVGTGMDLMFAPTYAPAELATVK
jgi:nucleoside-diphosphate-sugar epimerase